MAYIGKQPLVGNYTVLDSLTATTTDTYALTKNSVAVFPQTPANCIVSLNGVIQAPFDSYTISGSNIVFASALTASDSIDFITVLGDVLNVGTVSDGTIGLAKLSATGTKDATTFLRGDNTFATVSSDFVKLYETAVEYNPGVAYADYQGYFTNDYDHYKIIVMHTGSASAVNFQVRLGGTGGIDTGANYIYFFDSIDDAGTQASQGNSSASFIRLGWNGDASFKNTAVFDLINARNTGTYTHLQGSFICKDGTPYKAGQGHGLWKSTTAVDRIRIEHGSGTIQINSIAIYGYKT